MFDTSPRSKKQQLYAMGNKSWRLCVVLPLLQVFKVLVRKTPDESWVVFRRYTDFSRLNDKVCLGVFSVHIVSECMLICQGPNLRPIWSFIFCSTVQFADTVCYHELIAFSMLLFLSALWKWLELHKDTLCSQIANRPKPTRGAGLLWFWERQDSSKITEGKLKPCDDSIWRERSYNKNSYA